MSDDTPMQSFKSAVDDSLPESVDRRRFLAGTVATMGGLGLAGCTGGGGGGGGSGGSGGSGGDGSSGSGDDGTQTSGGSGGSGGSRPIWRYGWKAEPSYAIGFVAEQEGIWGEHLDTTPDVKEGFGSGDAAKRVGSGQEAMGMASIFPIITNFAEGGTYQVFGAGKARSQLGLIYNAEEIDGRDDLSGITLSRSSSAPQQLSWPYFRDGLGYSEGDMTVQGASESGAAAQLSQGQIDAVYDTITDWTAIRSKVDMEIGFIPLYTVVPIYGYNLFVNTSKVEDMGDGYMADLMTAYSQAGKWVLLNPGEAVDIMRNEVNTDLQTVDRSSQMEGLAAGVIAVNATEDVKENGFGYLDTEVLSQTIEVIADGSDIDAPSVDEIANTEIQEEADLATFSDSEWDQVLENGTPFTDQFDV
jgi:ABC-type nitrate/sulfonate/bicarbonate transport system substrate-binding protein